MLARRSGGSTLRTPHVLFDLKAQREETWLIERFPEYALYRHGRRAGLCHGSTEPRAFVVMLCINATRGRVAFPPERDMQRRPFDGVGSTRRLAHH